MSDLYDLIEVRKAGGRVAGHLDMDQLGVRAHCRTDCLGVGDVEEGDLNVVLLRQVLAEQEVYGAVADLGNDDMVSAA